MSSSVDLFKQAVLEADAAQLSRLFENDPDLRSHVDDPLFSFDMPAIVQAAGRGDRAVVDALLDAGANIDARSSWWAGGFGVLDSASAELSKYLIGRGATVDVHAAARLGMLDKLRELVSDDPALVHARGGDGKTPLHCAGTLAIAEYLLSQRADVDAGDIDHESTPAQYLVQTHPEIVRALIARGCWTDILMAAAVGDAELVTKHLDADPESIRTRVSERFFPKKDQRAGGTIYIWTLGMNKTAHQVAARFGHQQIVDLLMDRSPADVQFVNGCATGNEQTVRAALEGRPDLVLTLSNEDWLQIVYSAQDNDAATVNLMLKYGWPVNRGGGITPLHWAAFHGNRAMVADLLAHNPSLESRDPNYNGTPLDWAIHGSENSWFRKAGKYADVVEALLDARAQSRPADRGSEVVKEVLRRRSGK